MIGLDTNVLARYFIQDEADAEAINQREAARRLIDSGASLKVSKSVLLELESVMRGYYGFPIAEILAVMQHLLSLPQVEIEDRNTVTHALSHTAGGLDFADALHLASYRDCQSMASFDDRKFARRAKRMNLSPKVIIPK